MLQVCTQTVIKIANTAQILPFSDCRVPLGLSYKVIIVIEGSTGLPKGHKCVMLAAKVFAVYALYKQLPANRYVFGHVLIVSNRDNNNNSIHLLKIDNPQFKHSNAKS